MDKLKTFVLTWYHIFIWANVCVWERISGQEVSCPKCWKCTTARWITFTIVIGGFLWLTGWWAHIAYGVIVLMVAVVFQTTYLLGWLISLFLS